MRTDTRGRILVVDDVEMNIEILMEHLEGYELAAASSGTVALSTAEEFRPDLVMLDIMMPGMDGYTVCRRMRKIEALTNTKIIMVSTNALRDDRLKGYEAGADDYIVKPIDGQEVRAKVQVYMHLHSDEAFNKELGREVEEQTRTITAARLAAEEANHAKDRFVSTMSHELRNPLTAILCMSEMMERETNLTDDQMETVGIIHEGAMYLSALVGDVFDVAKVERNAVDLDISSFATVDYVRSTVRMHEAQRGQKQQSITVTLEPDLEWLSGDERRCRQILMNFMSNAAKYSPEGGSIEIRAERLSDSMAKISVIDTGPGIEPKDQEQLFTEFYQVDRKRDKKLGGSGIGLALTRRLARLHGGDAGVDSQPGKGSTFWFTLPLKYEA